MNWNEKSILITGGTGSFATNFIRFLLKEHRPKVIRIYSRDEHKQTEFLGEYGGIRGDGRNSVCRGFIGDIRDRSRLRMAMEGVDIVIHAAALKQVQSCEYNPLETIKTNVIGAQNIIEAALDAGVEKVLGISTDKAVAPLNLYGSTKLCMERLFQQANSYRGGKKTKFACTRYGNVADSRGTVVHIWRKQVREGKPIAITNPSATRFWITMKNANKFVMEAVELMDDFSGGEVFCPKIPSVKVDTLRHALAPSSHVDIIGERVGDKLHELMALKEELRHSVIYKDRIVILPEDPSWPYAEPEGCVPADSTHDYSSGTNERFLSVEEIQESLGESGEIYRVPNSNIQQAVA